MANVRSATGRRSGSSRPEVQWQPTLLGAGADVPAIDASFAGARRIALDEAAWVEHVPAWVHGAEALFELVVANAPWEHRRVRMYDRMVDEPRLTAWYGRALDDASLPPVVRGMVDALRARYGRAFDGVGAALYRDGRDSVAWHSDRVDPTLHEPLVAIASLGSARTLRMRSKQKGPTRPFLLLPGDLFVMGGATQATWEHTVPKVASAG